MTTDLDPGFDAARYARRIGLDALPDATPDGVRRVIAAHTRTIPFENLGAFLGLGVSLEPSAVMAKLVDSRRGGWCFEQNLLLGLALRSMGVSVTDLAAQVIWFRPPGTRSARTHRLLLLELEGGPYLADAGFGAVTPTDLIRLVPDVEQRTSHEPFRLTRQGERWQLEVWLGKQWQPVYLFDLNPIWPDDFGPVNYQLSHDPESAFVKALNVTRVVPGGRISLRDAEFTRRGRDGSAEVQRLRDVPEILAVLADEFGIDAAGLPGVRERLARCIVQ